MSDWSQPRQISDLEAALPAECIGKMIPPWEDIPEEFRKHYHPWTAFSSRLFFRGGHMPELKDGIDMDAAARQIHGALGSFEPKHEHKEAAVGYLLSLWAKSESPPTEQETTE